MKIDLGGRRFTVDWNHSHFDPRPLPGGDLLVTGATTCVILPVGEEDVATGILGVAWCSEKDVFKKETGRKVSLTRALEKWGLSRPERAQVWRTYLNRN